MVQLVATSSGFPMQTFLGAVSEDESQSNLAWELNTIQAEPSRFFSAGQPADPLGKRCAMLAGTTKILCVGVAILQLGTPNVDVVGTANVFNPAAAKAPPSGQHWQ